MDSLSRLRNQNSCVYMNFNCVFLLIKISSSVNSVSYDFVRLIRLFYLIDNNFNWLKAKYFIIYIKKIYDDDCFNRSFIHISKK
jgi:hypothetical protein